MQHGLLKQLDRVLGPLVSLSPQSIAAAACKFAGKQNQGQHRTLIRALERHISLLRPGIGFRQRMMMRLFFIQKVTNRVLIDDYIRKNPEVVDTPVHPPVVILGMPRTGPTLLQRILACDPQNRTFLEREVLTPLSGMGHSLAPYDAALLRLLRRAFAQEHARKDVAELEKQHESAPDLPEEMYHLFFNTFIAAPYLVFFDVLGRSEGLMGDDWEKVFSTFTVKCRSFYLTHGTAG